MIQLWNTVPIQLSLSSSLSYMYISKIADEQSTVCHSERDAGTPVVGRRRRWENDLVQQGRGLQQQHR
jgi:hypothetical protein